MARDPAPPDTGDALLRGFVFVGQAQPAWFSYSRHPRCLSATPPWSPCFAAEFRGRGVSSTLVGLVFRGATALPIAAIVAFVLGAVIGAYALLDVVVVLTCHFFLRRELIDPGAQSPTR